MIDGKITELLQTKGMEYDETSASWYGTVSGYSMKELRTGSSRNQWKYAGQADYGGAWQADKRRRKSNS